MHQLEVGVEFQRLYGLGGVDDDFIPRSIEKAPPILEDKGKEPGSVRCHAKGCLKGGDAFPDLISLGLDRLGSREQVIPGPVIGRIGDTGDIEDLLVVEESERIEVLGNPVNLAIIGEGIDTSVNKIFRFHAGLVHEIVERQQGPLVHQRLSHEDIPIEDIRGLFGGKHGLDFHCVVARDRLVYCLHARWSKLIVVEVDQSLHDFGFRRRGNPTGNPDRGLLSSEAC